MPKAKKKRKRERLYYYRCYAENVDPAYYNELRKASYGHEGRMWSIFCEARNKWRGAVVSLVRDANSKLVGWALLELYRSDYGDGDNEFNIYVKREYRRRGIGTKLTKTLLRHPAVKRHGFGAIHCHVYSAPGFFHTLEYEQRIPFDIGLA